VITGILRTFQLGLRGVGRHGLRSLLTCLGVLFGVASVLVGMRYKLGVSRQVTGVAQHKE